MHIYIYKYIYIIYRYISFWAYPLKKLSGWFDDTQDPSMMGAECQKIIEI